MLYECLYFISLHIITIIKTTDEFKNVGDAALSTDAYDMNHNSTLQNLTASTHALLLDRPTIFTWWRCTSLQFIGRPQRQVDLPSAGVT